MFWKALYITKCLISQLWQVNKNKTRNVWLSPVVYRCCLLLTGEIKQVMQLVAWRRNDCVQNERLQFTAAHGKVTFWQYFIDWGHPAYYNSIKKGKDGLKLTLLLSWSILIAIVYERYQTQNMRLCLINIYLFSALSTFSISVLLISSIKPYKLRKSWWKSTSSHLKLVAKCGFKSLLTNAKKDRIHHTR